MNRMMTEKKIALEIRQILKILGIRFQDRGEEIRCACPIHKSDNPTSMSINPRQNRWACWSRGCHEEYPGGLFGLFQTITGKTDVELEAFVNDLMSQEILDLPEFEELDTRENKPINLTRQQIKERLCVPSEFYLKRGFSKEVLEEFLIGDCFSDKRMRDRTVFPIIDINGNFIGCSGRTHSDKKYISKWVHSKGLICAATFYGIDKAKDELKNSKVAILVEGPGDVVKLYEYGIRNAISPFGTKLTRRQRKLLTELGVETILIGFDNDEAGKKATKKIISKNSDVFRLIDLQLRCDPDEMTKSEWDTILKEHNVWTVF